MTDSAEIVPPSTLAKETSPTPLDAPATENIQDSSEAPAKRPSRRTATPRKKLKEKTDPVASGDGNKKTRKPRSRKPKAESEPEAGIENAPAGVRPAHSEKQEADLPAISDQSPDEQPDLPETSPPPFAADFESLGLSSKILASLKSMGYATPTPIQAHAIPAVFAGRDIFGIANTGTGKTAAFSLPVLQKLSETPGRAKMPRCLILEPTRELALQVSENLELYGKDLGLSHVLLIGGTSMADQRNALMQGADILIATPGRLLDLFERGGLLLTQTRFLVIDEADRMLDMGFVPDIEKIVSLLPLARQTLFFSATLPPPIQQLAEKFLHNPQKIQVSVPSSVAATIEEKKYLVSSAREKPLLLLKLVLKDPDENAIVFCNRKRDVDHLVTFLKRHHVSAAALHGDLSQDLRFSTLEKFRQAEIKILVCSDVAARGIDIGGLSHVYNFDLPFSPEDYVHRIGRTGRAGIKGTAISLMTPEEQPLLDALESLTGHAIPLAEAAQAASSEQSVSPLLPAVPDLPENTERPVRRPRNGRHNARREKDSAAPGLERRNVHPAAGQNEDSELTPAPQRQKNFRNGNEVQSPGREIREHDAQHGFGAHLPDFIVFSRSPELKG